MTSLTNQHTLSYDQNLQRNLPHLVNYPELLPFIGKSWDTEVHRVLFIGESHYLRGDSLAENNSQNWYTNNANMLSKEDRQNINTRNVINSADYYCLDKNQYCKAHSIFYNIKSAIFESQKVKNVNQAIFNRFCFYNYFQRPAETAGNSIRNLLADDELAYRTLNVLSAEVKPTQIIFVSKKAFISFNNINYIENKIDINLIKVCHVPHPSSAWWNRESKAYDGKTGRRRLIDIFSTLNFDLS